MTETKQKKGNILAVATMKGGTAKTTTAAAILQAAVASGIKALAVDLDPQGNLSNILKADSKVRGAKEALNGTPAIKCIQETESGISLMGGRPELAAEESGIGSARRLAKALSPIKDSFGLIVIDTPPAMGELVYNALYAADRLLIPVEADGSAIQAIYDITGIAGQIHELNNTLEVAGVVVTRYDSRSKLNRQYKEAIEERTEAAGYSFLGTIRAGIALKEAQTLKRSLFVHAPKSKPALDYMDLYNKLTSEE